MSSVVSTCQIIPGRLDFQVRSSISTFEKSDRAFHYFSIDNTLRHLGFYTETGPLNLGNMYHFTMMLNNKRQRLTENVKIIFYCKNERSYIANAATLIGCYQVTEMGLSPEEAYATVRHLQPFLPFRDACMGPCTYKLTVLDCLSSIKKAHTMRWFDWNTFNLQEYEHFEQVEHGDLNTIIPGVFLAMAGPHESSIDEDGLICFTPEDYAPIFRKFGVRSVIRLNRKMYDRQRILDMGLEHHDMYFVDGTAPSLEQVDLFNEIIENRTSTVAVHCTAGLGRTGTLMACYMMKHYMLTANEAIAWLRICRPGSVIGPQQYFVKGQQKRMHYEGQALEAKRAQAASLKIITNPGSVDEMSSPLQSPGSTSSVSSLSMSYSSDGSDFAGSLSQSFSSSCLAGSPESPLFSDV